MLDRAITVASHDIKLPAELKCPHAYEPGHGRYTEVEARIHTFQSDLTEVHRATPKGRISNP